jgi:hypothetical protein
MISLSIDEIQLILDALSRMLDQDVGDRKQIEELMKDIQTQSNIKY